MVNVIKYIIISIIILLLQVLVLNNLNIKGYAIPFLYLWIILRLPASMSRIVTISLGFFIGLIVDIFSNTLGMHALATTFFAFMKEPVTLLYISREDVKNNAISLAGLGASVYLKLLLTMVMIFCISIYLIEAFTFVNVMHLLLKIGTSFLSTFVIISAFDKLNLIHKNI